MNENSGWTWTEERVATAAKRYLDGESCAQIGKSFGVSRNSVIGILNRRGIKRPVDISTSKLHARRAAGQGIWNTAQPRSPMPAKVKRAIAPEPGADVPPALPDHRPLRTVQFLCEPVTLLGLEPGMCKYPVDHRDGEHLFCGHKRPLDRVYCLAHAEIAFIHGSATYSSRSLPKGARADNIAAPTASSDDERDLTELFAA